jgi:hypothetical protein
MPYAMVRKREYFYWAAGRFCSNIIAVLILFIAILSQPVAAAIQFEDASSDAGITNKGATFGASWGDFNGDGWPDLWVGNHNRKPTLYINDKRGGFSDIIDRVWSENPALDTHGAAWADFDNDGDQDLVEVLDVGVNEDGTLTLGVAKNHLFINEGGKLVESAAELGLDATGQARSPLWFDANRDGLLDLLVANVRGPNDSYSKIWLQDKKHRFSLANEKLDFIDAPWSKKEVLWARVENLINFNNNKIPRFNTHRGLVFASLGDLALNGQLDLFLFSYPSRGYDIREVPFEGISNKVGLPKLDQVKDAVIGDYNGDGRMDLIAVEGSWLTSHVIQPDPTQIGGRLTWTGGHGRPPKSVTFQAEGEVEWLIYPTWIPLFKVFIGKNKKNPTNRFFTLSPHDPDTHGVPDLQAEGIEGVAIGFDSEKDTWILRNVQKATLLDFTAKANKVFSFGVEGFSQFDINGNGIAFFREAKGFSRKSLEMEAGTASAAISVVSADFDNDMDLDLYLTCTGPVENLPNRLLENDGKGNFVMVADAGGAAGSTFGRGDAAVTADYDHDGFLDLFVTNGADPNSIFEAKGPHQLFRNRGNGNRWLEIDLEGVVSNRDAIGATVEILAGGVKQVREQNGGMHRIAQNHQRLHFGLGPNKTVDQILVTWPSGIKQNLTDIESNQILHIIEPAGDKK